MSQTTMEEVNILKDVIHKKTSSLFELCFILPWILANYNKTDRELEIGVNQMKTLARQFGLLFQISDDFEDVEKDSTRDDNSSSINYVIRKGYEEAYKDYTTIDKQFKDLSRKEKVFTPEIKQLVTYLKDKATIYYRQMPN
jgi:geranylgeranyl diphosphate synthase type II